jgi:hypothetical protein
VLGVATWYGVGCLRCIAVWNDSGWCFVSGLASYFNFLSVVARLAFGGPGKVVQVAVRQIAETNDAAFGGEVPEAGTCLSHVCRL